ncbi:MULTISPECIES: M56 family metallopeptidase [Nocardia]|uniref:M56 family metallopeptidase n=1 Tax=Nocardia TaxID=1817 RepID=UPI0020A55C9D|nr:MULTISPECIES: M56 family metallopeptidase [Nocardia]
MDPLDYGDRGHGAGVMSVAVCLLAYSMIVAVLSPALLVRSTRAGRRPRLSLVAWVSAIGSVLVSWAAAVVFVVIDVVRDLLAEQHLDLGRCFTQLHDAAAGAYGSVVRLGLAALVVLALTAAAVVLWRLTRMLLRARSVTHRHAQQARMVGRRHHRHDAVVLDHPEPAAYSVAGNPHAIVLTQGIVTVLDDVQLAAVMAHERAHLSGHHHFLLAVTRALARVFPRLDLFVTGAAQVARLVEMVADDAAARVHGPLVVREALLTLADSQGAGHLGSIEVGLVDRVRRLSPSAATGGLVSSMAMVAVVLGPLAATFAAMGGLGLCILG